MARIISIVRPLPYSLAGSSNMGTTNNLLTPDPKETASVTAASAGALDIDLGAVFSLDTIFVGYASSNLGALTVTYGTTVPTTSTLVTSLASQSSSLVVPDYHRPFVNTTPFSARYLRFSFASAAAKATFGILAVGLSVPLTWGHEFGSGRPIEDTGNVDRLFGGGFGIQEGVRVGGFQWTFGDLSDAEVEALFAVAKDLGNTRSVLVVEDPTQSSGLNERVHWGLFDRLEPYERQVPGASRYGFKVRDWA